MARVLPPKDEYPAPRAASFKSLPESTTPRRKAQRVPKVMGAEQQRSTTMIDALAASPVMSLVRQPTVEINQAFTADVRGARRELVISDAMPEQRHIVLHDKPVGSGGQAVVYAATNTATGASLVYKHLRSKDMQAALAEALQEANVAKAMDSPMAPMVVQASDGVALIARAMPTDLLQSIQGIRKASWGQVRTLGLEALFDVAREVRVLHAKGYVHCDIKADNVLRDSGKHWRLADFGHAARIHDFAALNKTRGTMAYWAPELFAGEPQSEKTDIYSLGLLYLTVLGRGKSPMYTSEFLDHYANAGAWEEFCASGHQDLDSSAWMQEHPAFAQIYTLLNASERTLVRWLLDPDPSQRPTAKQLVQWREAHPALQRSGRTLRSARSILPSDAFEATHDARMREVLGPKEMRLRKSYSSSSSEEPEVPTPRTPTRDETTPTHRRR